MVPELWLRECLLLFTFVVFATSKSVEFGQKNETVTGDKKTAFITNIDTGSNVVPRQNHTLKYAQNLTAATGGSVTADIRSTIKDTPRVCQTDTCKNISERIATNLDQSVEPCDDFYEFACGGWINKKKIPSCENEITSFTVLTKTIENQIQGLIQQPAEPGESLALEKARNFFKSCMDEDRLEELGPKPALDFIEYIGGWSICDNDHWNQNKDKWKIHEVLKKLQKNFYPAPPFLSFEVTNDHLNSSKHLIKIDQSGLSLQREIYCKHEEKLDIMESYGTYMTKIARYLGYKCDNVEEEMREILTFEKTLARLTTPAEAKQAGTFRRININILASCIPQFPWYEHIKTIFPGTSKIKKDDVVLATSPTYLYNVATLMKKTPKKLLSKYVVWQMLRDKISFLSKDFRKARAEFNRKMTGVEDTEERWRTCTTVTNDNMGVPIGTLYVNKYFSDTTREKTLVMFDEVIKSFKERIKEHKWIDDKTRAHVDDKADAMVAKLGHASYIKNVTALNRRFESLNISAEKFFENNLNVDRWIRYRLFNKLRKTVDKSKWPMFPQTINAMYQFYENEIVIPAGILQPPFYYHGSAPMSLSYGGIGTIIGHEITHGFDNTGRKFDKNGDIKGEQWTQKSIKNFCDKSKCLIDQYDKYKVQDKFKVHGKLTLGENIADNGGVKLAYDAYKDWVSNQKEEQEVLPGLKYDSKQLFFIGFAQQYCAKIRSKTEQLATMSEIHSPSKFRVIGSLSNFEAFTSAFKCSKDAKMNPPKKCEVW